MGRLVPDVVIDGWSHPWNLRGDRSVGGAPPAALWASDPAGFGQVGCVYTAQGFEYDHAGVIIGPDFVWREEAGARCVTPTVTPTSGTGRRCATREFDRLVRNVYKVLLTRGMQSVTIYSTDPQTRERLRDLAPPNLRRVARAAQSNRPTNGSTGFRQGHASPVTHTEKACYDELDRHDRRRPRTALAHC